MHRQSIRNTPVRRSRRGPAALFAGLLLAVAACGGSGSRTATAPNFGGLPGSNQPSDAVDGGPTAPERFVILTQPDAGPVDLFTGSDGNTGKKLAEHLEAGTVTDYLQVPRNDSISVVDGSGKKLGTLSGPPVDGKQRATAVIGVDNNFEFNFETMIEDGTHVLHVSVDDHRPSSGNAFIVTDGFGVGPIIKALGVALGDHGKDLHDDVLQASDSSSTSDSSDDENVHSSVAAGVTKFEYNAPAADVELAWFGDDPIHAQETKPVTAHLDGDHDVYAFAWFADATHLHLLLVPVNADGAGDKGVVDSGDGPAFTQPTDKTVVAGETESSDSATDGSSSDDTATDTESSDTESTDSDSTDSNP